VPVLDPEAREISSCTKEGAHDLGWLVLPVKNPLPHDAPFPVSEMPFPKSAALPRNLLPMLSLLSKPLDDPALHIRNQMGTGFVPWLLWEKAAGGCVGGADRTLVRAPMANLAGYGPPAFKSAL
jgi:hypothetical protein